MCPFEKVSRFLAHLGSGPIIFRANFGHGIAQNGLDGTFWGWSDAPQVHGKSHSGAGGLNMLPSCPSFGRPDGAQSISLMDA